MGSHPRGGETSSLQKRTVEQKENSQHRNTLETITITKILKFIQQKDTKNFFTNFQEKTHIGKSALQRKKHLPIKNGTEPGIN